MSDEDRVDKSQKEDAEVPEETSEVDMDAIYPPGQAENTPISVQELEPFLRECIGMPCTDLIRIIGRDWALDFGYDEVDYRVEDQVGTNRCLTLYISNYFLVLHNRERIMSQDEFVVMHPRTPRRVAKFQRLLRSEDPPILTEVRIQADGSASFVLSSGHVIHIVGNGWAPDRSGEWGSQWWIWRVEGRSETMIELEDGMAINGLTQLRLTLEDVQKDETKSQPAE